MRLPRLFRTTPFRLTLLFLIVFAAAASAFLAYIYLATAGEVNRHADAAITREMQSLEAIYRQGGFSTLNQTVIDRASSEHGFLYLLMNKDGQPVSGSLAVSPVGPQSGDRAWASFRLNETDPDGTVVKRPARGLQERLPGGELMFVGSDVGEAEGYVVKIARALWALRLWSSCWAWPAGWSSAGTSAATSRASPG